MLFGKTEADLPLLVVWLFDSNFLEFDMSSRGSWLSMTGLVEMGLEEGITHARTVGLMIINTDPKLFYRFHNI